MMRGKMSLIVAGVLIVAAVGYLMVSNTGSTANYFLTIEELRAMGEQAARRSVTVSGAVLGDSIVYETAVPRLTFTIVQVPGDPKEVERQGGLAAVLHAAVADPALPRLEVVYNAEAGVTSERGPGYCPRADG
jgi:cytochrome c-type biogenesis protein CcmE